MTWVYVLFNKLCISVANHPCSCQLRDAQPVYIKLLPDHIFDHHNRTITFLGHTREIYSSCRNLVWGCWQQSTGISNPWLSWRLTHPMQVNRAPGNNALWRSKRKLYALLVSGAQWLCLVRYRWQRKARLRTSSITWCETPMIER